MDPPQSSWLVPRLHAAWPLSSLVPPEAEANVLWLRMGGGPAAPHTRGSSSCDFLAPRSAHPCLLPDYVLTAVRTQGRGEEHSEVTGTLKQLQLLKMVTNPHSTDCQGNCVRREWPSPLCQPRNSGSEGRWEGLCAFSLPHARNSAHPDSVGGAAKPSR